MNIRSVLGASCDLIYAVGPYRPLAYDSVFNLGKHLIGDYQLCTPSVKRSILQVFLGFQHRANDFVIAGAAA